MEELFFKENPFTDESAISCYNYANQYFLNSIDAPDEEMRLHAIKGVYNMLEAAVTHQEAADIELRTENSFTNLKQFAEDFKKKFDIYINHKSSE